MNKMDDGGNEDQTESIPSHFDVTLVHPTPHLASTHYCGAAMSPLQTSSSSCTPYTHNPQQVTMNSIKLKKIIVQE